MLHINKNSKIKYNHLKLVAVYKAPKLYQIKRIQKAQQQDPDSKDYKCKELMYILRSIAEEFIKDFHRGLI